MYKKLVGILAACGIVTSLTQTVSVFAQSTASVNSSITSHILKQDTNFSVPYGLKQTEQLVNTVLQKQPYMNELLTGENFSSNGITTTVHVAWQQSTQQSSVLDAKIHTVLAKLIKPRMSDYDKEIGRAHV
jgi:hypothetical protein